jgi:histidyl-tRNA synthetase
MNDVLPAQTPLWQQLESTTRAILESYGYEEMRVPVVEQTDLFKRAIGEFTDVVEKEMYSFVDQGGERLTLRPEATAGIVRAAISNGMLRGARHKVWCTGPMFRHEKPQKGRFRQFHQVDVEAIGFEGPDIDAELIAMTARLWRALGIGRVRLQVNSLGTPESRRAYRDTLVGYFESRRDQLDPDSLRRLAGNPLRILDSKNPQMQDVVAGAPLLTEHLDAASAAHFDAVCRSLQACGIEYTVNPRLVRGLDYYSRTVFEWTTGDLGSQDAVCSGGRYDGLVVQLGGDPVPAIGWALGEERIVELLRLQGRAATGPAMDVYLVLAGPAAERLGSGLAETLRDLTPGLRVETNCGGGSLKSQMKRADKSGARMAVILGEDEVTRRVATLKSLREDVPQRQVPLDELPAELARTLHAAGHGRE